MLLPVAWWDSLLWVRAQNCLNYQARIRHETRTEWRAARELPKRAETPAQIEAPLPALRTQVQDIQNSGHAPGEASESAIIANLPPGNYTAIVRGVNNTTGVALVEVYDLH